MRSVLIKNGHVVSPHWPDFDTPCDVLIRDGKVKDIKPRIQPIAPAEEFDATGCWVLPGAIDLHVHFRDPHSNPAESLWTGSRAAAAGGITAFADMPNTDPITTPGERLEQKLALAAGRSLVDYAFYVTDDLTDETKALSRLDATLTPGVKGFLGGTTNAQAVDDLQLGKLLRACDRVGVPITVHAEEDIVIIENRERLKQQGVDPDATPDYHARARDFLACVTSTCRALRHARRYNVHVHIAHVTTATEVELIRQAKTAGDKITAEVTLHHLQFCDEDYERLGHELKCNPSVKTSHDRAALWGGLLDGTIDMVGTDHAPHPRESKEGSWEDAPSGVASAVEYLMPALVTMLQTRESSAEMRRHLPMLANWTCRNPIRIFGIENKGALEIGRDGDAVVLDPSTTLREHVYSARGASPWTLRPMQGWPKATFLRGQKVFDAVDGPLPKSSPGQPLRFAKERPDPRH